jgi:Trypsin
MPREEGGVVRRLILVFAVMGVAVLLASGAALGITGGTEDGNGHPYVGALVDGSGAYCSGTLVAGKDGDPVFVTAAHCEEPGQVYVTFDPEYVAEGRNFANPGVGVEEYSGTLKDDGKWYVKGHDIAVVDFDSNSTPSTIPLAQLPTLGKLADTAKGDKFTAVGYGATSGSSDDYGKRRYALSTFKSLNRTYLSTSQHRGSGGTCYGDSGGPNFIGTSNVIASTTITGDTWCKATNVTLRLDTVQAQNILADLGVKTQ